MRHWVRQTGEVPARGTRAGFTIVEIFFAVAIVAVLAAIAIPVFRGQTDKAERRIAVMDIQSIETSVDQYITEFGAPPNNLSSAMRESGVDPWGNPYEYLNLQSGLPGVNGQRRRDRNLNPINSDYDLYSKGPDGNSHPQLQNQHSLDDIVRANDGAFVDLATEY